MQLDDLSDIPLEFVIGLLLENGIMIPEYLDLEIALLKTPSNLLGIPLLLIAQQILLLLPHQRLPRYIIYCIVKQEKKDIRLSEVRRLLAHYPRLHMHAHVAEAYLHLVGCLVLVAVLPCLLEALQAFLVLGR